MSANTANTEKKLPSSKSFTARFKRLKTAAGGVTVTPSPTAAVAREPVVTRSSPAKTHTTASSTPTAEHGTHPVPYPNNFGFGEGQTLWPFLSHLKLPGGLPDLKDRSVKDAALESAASSFKVMQVNLQAVEMLEVYEQRMISAEQENKVLAAKVQEVAGEVKKLQRAAEQVDKLQKVADDLSGKCNDALDREFAAKDEVARLTAELQERTLQLQECQEQLDKKKQQLLACGGYVAFLTRIECMEEHAAGKSGEWDLSAERKALDESFPERPVFSMLEGDDDQEMGEVSSRVDAVADGSGALKAAEDVPAEKAGGGISGAAA